MSEASAPPPPVPLSLELASTLHRYLAGRPAAEAGRLFFAVEDALLTYQAEAQRPKAPARRARRRTRQPGASETEGTETEVNPAEREGTEREGGQP